MIKFNITIEELPNGQIRCTCETPPAAVSRKEHAVGEEFKEVFREFTCAKGRTVIVHDWDRPGSEKRN